MYIAKLLSTFLLLIHCYSYSFAYWLPIIPFHSLIHLNCYPFFWPSPPAFSPKTFPISFRSVLSFSAQLSFTYILLILLNRFRLAYVWSALFMFFPSTHFVPFIRLLLNIYFCAIIWQITPFFFLLSHFATLRASFSTTFRYILTVVICDGYTFSFPLFSVLFFFASLILPLGYELSFVRLFTGDWNLL